VPELSPTPAAPPRTFWQRRVRDPLIAQLTQGITPEKLALTIAVGTGMALFPLWGTTTLLCLAVGVVLRLNQPVIQAVNYLCMPIHLPFIYASVRAGEWLFGAPPRPFHLRAMMKLFWEEPGRFFREFGTTGFHAVVIWAIVVPFWIAIVYGICRPLLREISRVHHESVAKAALEKARDHPVP
jgi:uncharacterized protein (DUF2062 family)